MSLKRAFRRIGKVVKKVAPLAAVAGLGILAGPAGVGLGQRLLGGLSRIGKGSVKLAAPIIEAAARGQEQQSAASPGFDQSDAALPAEQRFVGGGFGRHRGRFSRTLSSSFSNEGEFAEPATFSNGAQPMSLLGTALKLPAVRNILTGAAGSVLGSRMDRALPSLPGAGRMGFKVPMPATRGTEFRTGGGFGGQFDSMGFRRKSKRINPTNVKALRRALRRVEGFVKLEKRVDKILRRAAPAARTARKSGFVKSRRR